MSLCTVLLVALPSLHCCEIFKETAMIEGHEDKAPPSENVIPESVTSGSTNVQLAASRTLTEELLPHSASSGK